MKKNDPNRDMTEFFSDHDHDACYGDAMQEIEKHCYEKKLQLTPLSTSTASAKLRTMLLEPRRTFLQAVHVLSLGGNARAVVLNIHGEPRRLVVFALEPLPDDDKRSGRGNLRGLVNSSH